MAVLGCVTAPVLADDAQDIGIVAAVDRAHMAITCDCASNTLADMSQAKRHTAAYKMTSGTSYSIKKPFPHGEAPGTFAKVSTGQSVIVDYHLVGATRVVDEMTILDEDCRPNFCGPR